MENYKVEILIALRKEGLSYSQIAKKLGISKSTVGYHIKANPESFLDTNSSTKLKYDLGVLAKMYNAGETYANIRKMFGVSETTLKRYVDNYPEIFLESERVKGKKKKSEWYDTATLVEMYAEGASYLKIAKTLGISDHTVKKYVQNNPEICEPRVKCEMPKYDYDRIAKLRAEGKTAKEISEILGIKLGSLNSQIRLHPDKLPKINCNYDLEKLIQLWNLGVAATIIAKELHITKEIVANCVRLHRNRCDSRTTKYDERKLVTMYLVDEMSVVQIAKEVGISKDVVKYFIDKSDFKEVKLIIKKCKGNKSYKEIAMELGITESKVSRTVKQYGNKCVKKRNTYNPNDIVKLWNQNLTTSEIAKKLGISKDTVSKFASRHRELCPAKA